MREHIGGVLRIFAGFFFVLGSVRGLASDLKEEEKSSCCFPLRLAFSSLGERKRQAFFLY